MIELSVVSIEFSVVPRERSRKVGEAAIARRKRRRRAHHAANHYLEIQ
jgi:hypothetical protein